jgi:hypothetical protein
MRTTLWLCSALVGVSLAGGRMQTPQPCASAVSDPYYIAFVSSAFDFFKESQHRLTSSFEAKRFTNLSPSLPQLGDAVSIAVLKTHERDELVEPENATAYLVTVRNSFIDRSRVTEKSDTEPKVTSLVLNYLAEKEIGNPGIEKNIAYIKGCVKEFTCSSQGNADYFKSH